MDFKPAITRQLLGRRVGKDRRTMNVTRIVDDQETFDQLFALLFGHERALVVRSAKAVAYITRERPELLVPHKPQLLALLDSGDHKDLKPYLPMLISRIDLTKDELATLWTKFGYITRNPNEAKTVRLNALQALHDLVVSNPSLKTEFSELLHSMRPDQVQALQIRINKLASDLKIE